MSKSNLLIDEAEALVKELYTKLDSSDYSNLSDMICQLSYRIEELENELRNMTNKCHEQSKIFTNLFDECRRLEKLK